MPTKIRLIEARPDWLTCSAPAGARADLLEGFANAVILAESDAGDRVSTECVQGYIGERCGGVISGSRADGVLVPLPGSTAADYTTEAARLADHWSRLDYCVTVDTSETQLDPVTEAWRALKARQAAEVKTPGFTRLENSKGGETLYIGSRSSAAFGRCYNKHVETRGEYPPGSWRWEVEYKRHLSEAHQRKWSSSALSEVEVQSIVASEFERWGTAPPFSSLADVGRTPAPPRKRDLERTRTWLSTQVAPAAQWMAESLGPIAVLEALGLSIEHINKE